MCIVVVVLCALLLVVFIFVVVLCVLLSYNVFMCTFCATCVLLFLL